MNQKNIQYFQNLNTKLIAVSKNQPRSVIDQAIAFGVRAFGENKAQELLSKIRENDEIEWHFIGHLQTNKVKDILPHVTLIHSVDSLRLIETIQKEAQKINKIQDILIQVNIAEEKTKSGFKLKEVENVLHSLTNYPNIHCLGFMCMAPNSEDQALIESIFEQAHQLCLHYQLEHCSMGMSHDYLLAIKHHATMIRIGSAIFQEAECH